MLKLSNIVKDYSVGSQTVHALKGVSIRFRPNEFVAILGHSGCGKTTLLNIIGGLDRYTSGDMVIRGRSTTKYKSRDWDTYRNHSVGFVFQSYNLIPHQSVLANVELALTLSGIGKKERRRRAAEALEKVGLADQLNKKPNQLSGGQMQRVAIARALVNDPEILLADEPTGALDSDTSVQVMDLLKEIAKDRLVIMVTHNPELADAYATRIVRLLDGSIVADSNPYDGETDTQSTSQETKKRASMSLLTAFSLSLSNLLTKKGRTLMTAFAGSIGIVGIALILSISTGINDYIEGVEKDTLSNYPLTLEESTMDMSSMLSALSEEEELPDNKENTIYSQNVMSDVMDMMFTGATTNNLAAFKEYIESGESGLEQLTSEIRYGYSTPLNIYKADTSKGAFQVNPSSVFSAMGLQQNAMMSADVWTQLTDNSALLESQFKVLKGNFPTAWNEVVLVVSEDNRITDYTLYALGILDVDVLNTAIQDKINGKDVQIDTTIREFSYDDFLGLTFKVLPTSDHFESVDGVWVDRSEDPLYITTKLQTAPEIKIVGIVCPQEDSSASAAFGVVGYTGALMEHLIGLVDDSDVVAAQRADETINIFTGLPFPDPNAEPKVYTMDEIYALLPTLPQAQQAELSAAITQMQQSGMPQEQIASVISQSLAGDTSATLKGNLRKMGVSDLDEPSYINLYPIDFEAKDKIADIISDYNDAQKEEDKLTYTDYIGTMMSSVTTIINAISYILIAFVAISLVVSSIMIGIITNISVLERTKEIGILRAVGASKKDISHVFNAETMIVGLAAGLVGIGLTELLIIPINILIQAITNLPAKAFLPPVAALILLAISILLTAVAGIIPARSAANKDPVVALRTE